MRKQYDEFLNSTYLVVADTSDTKLENYTKNIEHSNNAHSLKFCRGNPMQQAQACKTALLDFVLQLPLSSVTTEYG